MSFTADMCGGLGGVVLMGLGGGPGLGAVVEGIVASGGVLVVGGERAGGRGRRSSCDGGASSIRAVTCLGGHLLSLCKLSPKLYLKK